MVFGVIKGSYRARCRFYLDDQRPTFIHWRPALPGAKIYDGVTPFHPERDRFSLSPLNDHECGELDSPRAKIEDEMPRGGVDGLHVEGSEQDFAGQSPVPDVIVPTVCGSIYEAVLHEVETIGAKPM